MPTYRNDSSSQSWRGENFSGEVVVVPPGHSIGTQLIISESWMTKTANTPYYNPYETWEIVYSSGEAKTQTVDATEIKEIQIYNRAESSGEAYVKFNNSSNDYAACLIPGRSIVYADPEILNRVSSVIIECSLGAKLDFVTKKK